MSENTTTAAAEPAPTEAERRRVRPATAAGGWSSRQPGSSG
jgi:hypothetical protein